MKKFEQCLTQGSALTPAIAVLALAGGVALHAARTTAAIPPGKNVSSGSQVAKKQSGGGGSLLDRMLNKAQKSQTSKKKSGAAKSRAAGAQHVSPGYRPGAVNKVDQKELIKKLTRQQNYGQSPQGQMKEMLARMHTSARRLGLTKAGPQTQEIQRRIVLSLNELIKMAERNQSGQGSGQGKKRQSGPKQMNQGPSQPGNSSGGSHAAKNHSMPTGPVESAQKNGRLFTQKRNWGNLPPKARQLIANGIQEQPLPQYKNWIDQYYRALANIGKKRH